MNKFYFYIVIFFYINFKIFSQSDSIKKISIPEVEIRQIKEIYFQTGIKKVLLDSMSYKKTNALSEVLMEQNYGQIQSYSPGQLSTPSFRGTSANHTAVIWNGFNIQSQMNGQTDFSLLQNMASNHVKVQMGGSGALWGSGAIGGVILLQNISRFNKGTSATLQLNAGSFNHFRQQAEVEISKKNWVSSIKIFNQNALNDFKYINTYLADRKELTQTNASIKIMGCMVNNLFKINNHNQIQANFWLQQADRQIPPTMLSLKKNESQFDFSLKSNLSYSYNKNFFKLNARVGYFIEKIQFRRPLYDSLTNQSNTLISEVETMFKLTEKQSFQLGFNHTFAQAEGDNLLKKQISRFSIFASHKIALLKDKLIFQTSLREQIDNANFSPFTFGFGLEAKVHKSIILTSNFNRNFRMPTLNDLYWNDPSGTKGNINLKPELGWTQDVSITYLLKKNNFDFSINSSVFNSYIDNWINWRENNFGRLTPQNLQSVWSRGVEYGFNASLKINKIVQKITFNSDYTISTIEGAKDINSNLLKKQLIYVPYNKTFINYSIYYKKTTLAYQWTYTGFRYSTEDNEEFLPAFHLSNIVLNQELDFKKLHLNAFLRLNNIFNQNYQILASRPMYGINFNVGVTFKFLQSNIN